MCKAKVEILQNGRFKILSLDVSMEITRNIFQKDQNRQTSHFHVFTGVLIHQIIHFTMRVWETEVAGDLFYFLELDWSNYNKRGSLERPVKRTSQITLLLLALIFFFSVARFFLSFIRKNPCWRCPLTRAKSISWKGSISARPFQERCPRASPLTRHISYTEVTQVKGET